MVKCRPSKSKTAGSSPALRSKFWSNAEDIHFNIPENNLHIRVLDDLHYWAKRTFKSSFSLLDIGQGNGRLLKRFDGSIPAEVTMVDFSEKGRRLAQGNTGILPDKWDGVTLPYKNNSFDLLVLFDVLLHIDPVLIKQVWSEVKRVSSRYIFVTTSTFPLSKSSHFCFSHDYETLFKDETSRVTFEYPHRYAKITGWYFDL